MRGAKPLWLRTRCRQCQHEGKHRASEYYGKKAKCSACGAWVDQIGPAEAPGWKPKKKGQRKEKIPPHQLKMPFGRYKGKTLGSLASAYLEWAAKTAKRRDLQQAIREVLSKRRREDVRAKKQASAG